MKKVTRCRACGSDALTPVLSLDRAEGVAPFPGLPKKASYVLCDSARYARACGLLQSAYFDADAPPAPSGRHPSNRDMLRALATEALELISGRDCAALDIGCNDGALLSYYPRWVERFGVDPSGHVEEVGAWAWSARASFPSPELNQALGEKQFDIITAASVLEHVDDPLGFLRAVRERLADDGVFALETLYSPMVLTQNSIDIFAAGVSAVYSLSTLEWLVRTAGMKVVKGALTAKAGGSIRLFIAHQANDEFDFDPWSERLARLWDEENALAMRAMQPYQSFERRAAEIRSEARALFKDIARRGETVHALGADAQMQAVLGWIGPAAAPVRALVDSHRAREADVLGKADLPIISEGECRAAEPDYILAPAAYRLEMLERWRETILLGAKMIFLTPRPHVITAANFASEFGKTIAGKEAAAGAETLRSILAAAGGPRLIAENAEAKSA